MKAKRKPKMKSNYALFKEHERKEDKMYKKLEKENKRFEKKRK